MKFFVTLLACILAGAATVRAHHGQSFLVVEDTQCACCDEFLLLSSFEWEKGAEGSEFGLSPAIYGGLTSRLSWSIEADFRDEVEGSWEYASVTPAAHFLLTPPDCSLPFKLGISAGYQFGQGAEFEDGPSIHAHGVDAFVGRFIIESKITDDLLAVFNVLNISGPDTAWGYAAGLRQRVNEKLSVGIEATGDFKSHGWQEMVGGIYYKVAGCMTVKLGAGFGLNETSPDFTLHTGLVFTF